MKKILILASKRGSKKEKFIGYLQEYFGEKAEIVLGIFPDLTFQIETGNTLVEIEGQDIRNFDLVYLRNTSGFQSIATGLAIYLESVGIKFFDKSFAGNFVGDKFTSLMHLAVKGVPVVPSFVCWKGAISKNKKVIVEKFGFPIVAKEVRTQRMKRVYLLKSFEDFDNLPDKLNDGRNARYLFQKFINIDREFRLLVLGKRVGVVHTKTRRNNSGFKIDYADMNEYPEFLDPKNVPDNIKEIAVKAAETLRLQIAGVDICKDEKTGSIFVFEVNRGPGVDYDTDVSQEMPEIAKYLSFEANIDKP